MNMKNIKIDLGEWFFIVHRHIGNYAKMCVKHYCESTEVNELYFDNVKTNIKRMEKFVGRMRGCRGLRTFKGYEDLDFLFCFVQYIIINDNQAKHCDRFLELAIEISSLISDEAREANETEYCDDAIRFRDYLCRLKIENKKGR